MNAQKLFNELVSKGYNAELVEEFAYVIDKDRNYKTVHIEDVLNKELIKIAISNGCIWTAQVQLYMNASEDNTLEKIIYEAIPNDMKSFDFVNK